MPVAFSSSARVMRQMDFRLLNSLRALILYTLRPSSQNKVRIYYSIVHFRKRRNFGFSRIFPAFQTYGESWLILLRFQCHKDIENRMIGCK